GGGVGGAGGWRAMITAEVLGLDVSDVRPLTADTDSIGHTDVTGGSRVTFATGMAVYEAAQDAARQLRERAAKVWEIKPEDVELVDGGVDVKDTARFGKSGGKAPRAVKELETKRGSQG